MNKNTLKKIAQGSSAVAFAYLIGKNASLEIFAEETTEENIDENIIEVEEEDQTKEVDLTDIEEDSEESEEPESNSDTDITPEQEQKDTSVSDQYNDTMFILSKDAYVKVNGQHLEYLEGKFNLNHVLDNSTTSGLDNLDRNLVLLGWNTKEDGSGTFLSKATISPYGSGFNMGVSDQYYQLTKETSGKTYYAIWGKGIKTTEFISEEVIKWDKVLDQESLKTYVSDGKILEGDYGFDAPTDANGYANINKIFYMWNSKTDGSGRWYKSLSDFYLDAGQTTPSGQYLSPDYQPDKLYAIWVDALFSSDATIKGDITVHLNNGTNDTVTILGNDQGYTPNELQTLMWEVFSRSEYTNSLYEVDRNQIPEGKRFLAVLPVSTLTNQAIDDKADWNWNTNEYYIIWQDKSTMEPYLLRKESDWKLIDTVNGYRIANQYAWSVLSKYNCYKTSYDEEVKLINYPALTSGDNVKKFNPRNYSSITFVANNGTNNQQQVSFDDLYKTNGTFLPNIPQAPSGFTFIGWNLKANASGVWIQKGNDTSTLVKYLFSQDYYPPEKVYAIFMRIAGNTEKPNVGTEYNGIYIAPGVELPNGEINISTIENENGKYVISVKKTKTVKKQVVVKKKRYVSVKKGVQTATPTNLQTNLFTTFLSAMGIVVLRKKKWRE